MANAKSNGGSPPQGQGPQVRDVSAAKPAAAAPAAGASVSAPVTAPASPPAVKAAEVAKPAEVAKSPAPAAPSPAALAKPSVAKPSDAKAPVAAAPVAKPPVAKAVAKPVAKPAASKAPAARQAAAKPPVRKVAATKAASGKVKAEAPAPAPVKAPAPKPVAPAAAKSVLPEAAPSAARAVRVVARTVAEALDTGARAARNIETSVRAGHPASGVETLAKVGLSHAREGYAAACTTLEQLQSGFVESAGVASKGAAEINGKMLDLMRAQADAAFGLWRQLIGAGSFSEALQMQTKGWRHGYEMTSAGLKDIAETTGRVAETSIKPVRRVIDAWGKRGA